MFAFKPAAYKNYCKTGRNNFIEPIAIKYKEPNAP
jgi:hypothetical protein